ncbi:hypothetical protein SOX05_08700 [Pseudomonas putida]|nr:hypothetical protein [Pseudomonas putida]MDY4319340.1 hypothetical protein [Pseudomonas putida]MDY4352725.1 hypothetical protein [Pseudomonas putida]
MSIRNKFDITTKKFYLVFDDNDTTTDKDVYTDLLNGSISDYLGFKSHPMIMYAGKAIKHLQRELDASTSMTGDIFWNHDSFKKSIASCSVALNELKKYNYYDLVGVYQIGDIYKVVDYKNVSELVQKESGYRLVEIPKELYIKLSAAKNKSESRTKQEIKTGPYEVSVGPQKLEEEELGYIIVCGSLAFIALCYLAQTLAPLF